MPRPPSMSRSPSPRPRYSESEAGSSADEGPAGKRKRSESPIPRDRSASPPTRRARPASSSRSPPPPSRSPASSRSGGARGPNSPSPSPPARARRSSSPRRNGTDAVARTNENGANGSSAAPEGAVANTGPAAEAKDAAAKRDFAALLGTRSGGAYIPPSRLRAMQMEAAKDKTSAEYQRMNWDALRKSINGLINKVNTSNIKHIVPELFGENLIRGKGLFARSIMRAQAASLPFTPIFAALVAIINTKLPQVGELVLVRLISQFRRAYKRNDKTICNATATFIAHLVNQYVAHELVALQILLLCLERPTDDSIEVAVGFMREVGLFLSENSPKANNTVFERFRAVLHEGAISKRCQYMIEVLFQVRKDKYKDNVIIPEGLDLVEEEEQITHRVTLDDELKVQEGLNLFKADPNFLQNEDRYNEIKREILGDSDDEDDSGSDADSEETDGEEEDDGVAPEKAGITDMTETNLINLRKTIYLTIMNSLNFEEAVHKLMKINIPEGREIELCNMIVECCSQERTYSNFYGLIGERFCKLNRIWTDCFQEAFGKYYDTIHRYETNKLRNIGRFFGHLLASDGISWAVLSCIKMNEDDTTSSSRIFVKIMMTEMIEEIGINKVVERFKVPELRPAFSGMLPMDNPKNTRFAINYFTAIGMGKITEDMRAYLADAPRILAQQQAAQRAQRGGGSSDESSSSDSSSEESSELSSSELSESDSESDYSRRGGRGGRRVGKAKRYSSDDSRSPSPPRRRRYSSDSRSPSRSPPRRRRYSSDEDSRSPPRRSRKRYSSDEDSRSPPPARKAAARSPSPPASRRRADSRSPPPPPPARRRRSPSRSRSRSPPPPPRRRYDSPPRERDNRDGPGYGRDARDGRDGRERGGYGGPPPPRQYNGGGGGGGGPGQGQGQGGRGAPAGMNPERARMLGLR